MLKHFNAYPPDDPRAYLPLAERITRIQAVTLDQVQQFHTDFWGTARGEIAIVGDFDDRAIEPLLRDTFTAWRSAAPYARIVGEYHDVAPVRLFVATADKENATLYARTAIALRDDDADAPALMLANTIFGGGAGLSNRLAARLRQQDGLSYSVGSGLSVNGFDRAGAWLALATAAPGNIDKVESGFRAELARMLKEGFTAREVDEARAGLLQRRLLARADDETLAQSWIALLDLQRSFAFSRQIEDRLRALTPEQLAVVVRRYLDPERVSVFVAGDPGKGAK